jgi:CheY-like chemotaxis protein
MSGEVILVIEDNERNRKLVRDVLTFHGYDVRSAVTAADGLVLARTEAPRLILLDIQLPDMEGTAALRQLRAQPQTAAIPVVALTAFAMSGDRERFLAAGFDGYLAKPIDVAAFPEQVRRYCDAAPQEA